MLRLRRLGCAACLLVVLAACGADDSINPATSTSESVVEPSATVEKPTQQPQSNDATVMYSTSFDDEAGQLFYTGETTFGAQASIVDGRYVVEVEDGEWQTITPGPMPHPRNGAIESDITLTGDGFGGLVARSSVDAAGNDWMYVCLFDESGWAGCVASRGDAYQDLFWAPIDDYVPGETQRLRVSVVDDRIELAVNGQVMGSAQDSSVQSGAWGVMAESQDELLTTVEFDNLSISIIQSESDPSTPTESDDPPTV